MNINATEIYEIGKELYDVIEENPFITRSALNFRFRTSSDDRKNQLVTAALSSMLTLGYIKKHFEEATSSVFFWTKDFVGHLPYVSDDITSLHPNPVDIFGEPPAVAPITPPDRPLSASVVERVDASNFDAVYGKLHGNLQTFYGLLKAQPSRIFNPTDACFVSLIEDKQIRGMTLGRMWAMGLIRRAVDLKDKKTVFYTLIGTFPASLHEVAPDINKAAKTRARKLKEKEEAARAEQSVKFPQEAHEDLKESPIEETKSLEEDFTDESGEELEESDSLHSDAEASEALEHDPVALIDSKQEFQFIRADGSVLTFDDAESRAWRQLILNINIERLKD